MNVDLQGDTASLDAAEATAREDLAAALRLAACFGFHEGICNHFSFMVPGTDDRFLINPQGVHWREMTPERLVTLDREGSRIGGKGTVEPTAFHIHTRIHLGLPRARCVLHTHMPHATSLATLEEGRLLPISQTACMFHGRVAYYQEYNGLVFDEAEGDRMVTAFGDADILFLANHGVIVIAADVAQAFNDLYYLERACQLQVLALSTGQPLRIIPETTARRTAAQFRIDSAEQVPLHFAALKRVLSAGLQP